VMYGVAFPVSYRVRAQVYLRGTEFLYERKGNVAFLHCFKLIAEFELAYYVLHIRGKAIEVSFQILVDVSRLPQQSFEGKRRGIIERITRYFPELGFFVVYLKLIELNIHLQDFILGRL